MTRWNKLGMCLAVLLLAVGLTNAAPVQDSNKETAEDAALTKDADTLKTEEKPVGTKTSEEEKASEEIKDAAVSKEDTDEVEGSGVESNEEETGQPNEEVTNYKEIEADDDSQVTNENNELSYPGSFGNDFDEYRLTEEDAKELLRELANPAQVALFIMESDDVTGFLRSVQMLQDQGFISAEYAYFLKEAVSEELEQLLMIQDEEIYGDPLGIQTVQTVDNDYVDEMLNRPIPYFPEDYFDNTLPYQDVDLYPEPQDYDIFQQPHSDETMALAEIASIIAGQVERGEMSIARGERIIDILSQLLPEGFWQDDDISDEMMEDLGEVFANLYPDVPEGDQYQTFEREDDEPLPGGERHIKEEVIVDDEGRPVAEMMNMQQEQETGAVANGEEAQDIEGELEKELLEMEPETADNVEKALQDAGKLATGEEDIEDELEEETKEETDKSGWRDLVLLLDEGKLSDELLKELGLTSEDLLELTGRELAANGENVGSKP